MSSIRRGGTAFEISEARTVVRRPDPRKLVQDLTRQLAEEFDSVSIPLVTTAVNAAVNAVTLFGDNVADSIDTVERIAREDLTAVQEFATVVA